MSETPRLTDRRRLTAHRARAAQRPERFLHAIVADELQERLSEVNKSFHAPAVVGPLPDLLPGATLAEDADRLALDRGAHDLVVHAMALHWADDPVGQLVQSRLALGPDGLFLGALLGGQTLQELRASLAEAESRLTGGLSPRVAPMADVRDLGGLLSRAGFALPVADVRRVTASYATLADLVRDLRGMGETSALHDANRRIPPRALFPLAEDIYRDTFAEDGRLIATFDLVFLTGWAPAADQPQPLRPGSATHRLADALGVAERPLHDTSEDDRSIQ